MEPKDRRFEKGFFAPGRFPVADKHLRAPGRKRLFVIGALGALVLGVIFLADAFIGRAATIASGPLSDSHALFGAECATCHVPVEGTPDIKCQSCHRQTADGLGVYTFDRHYAYRSGDLDRSAPSSDELQCAACHREHQGREASLQQVVDARCTSCHESASFRKDHPEFAFASEPAGDPANLKFTHAFHVTEVMAENELVDAEAACLTCHRPEPDGRSFEPLSFAQQCDGCHLTPTTATPPLPTGSGAGPHVATLGQIRASGAPGTLWAQSWNPAEFSDRGGQIQKRPVYHADPWVLYNLRKLRSEMYPGAELADLLRTSADLPEGDARVLHGEAIATLRSQIEALRAQPSPSVQRELQSLEELLAQLEQRLENPFEPLDETQFDVRVADRAAEGVDQAAYARVIDDLTKECQTCHVVEQATIKRVQADQSALRRAEFDHRAHVVHANCLDCHNVIPVREALASGGELPPEQDRAEIVNMPTIATCRSCHGRSGPADQCTTCHLFHPDKAHWSSLTRAGGSPE